MGRISDSSSSQDKIKWRRSVHAQWIRLDVVRINVKDNLARELHLNYITDYKFYVTDIQSHKDFLRIY